MATRITAPFGFGSTTDQVLEGIDLSGKRAIVTGAWSAIGIEAARALASVGADRLFLHRGFRVAACPPTHREHRVGKTAMFSRLGVHRFGNSVNT